MITNSMIGHCGRLGNQMYQFSVLYILHLIHGYEIKISIYNAINLKYELDKFYRMDLFSIFNLDKKYLALPDDIKTTNVINKWGVKHYDDIWDVSDGTDYRGDFQSSKYFQPYRQQLINLYQFNPLLVDKYEEYLKLIDNEKELVGIHVRRGDFIKLNNILDKEYYRKILNNYFPKDKYNFVCISDDIEWCKRNFPEYINFSNNYYGVELILLTKCKHIISSNSTFSWWGSFLNKNEGKKFMPNKWFSDEYMKYYNNEFDKSSFNFDGVIFT